MNLSNFRDFNFPALKNVLIQKAFFSKNDNDCIYFLTNSSALGFQNSQNNSNSDEKETNLREKNYFPNMFDNMLGEMISKNTLTNLVDLLDEKSFDKSIKKTFDVEIIKTIKEKFPDEWTVLQISKHYNPLINCNSFEEIVSFNSGVLVTVFKHSAINSYKDPLLFEIPKYPQENVFESFYEVSKAVNSAMHTENTDATTRELYWKRQKEIQTNIEAKISLFKRFIGPWSCAFTGNFKSLKSLDMEAKIRKKVNEFFRTHQYLEPQQKLIHMVARRTDLLSNPNIFLACAYILKDKPNLSYNDVDLNNLYDFLTWLKQEFVYEDTTCYPVILIVDELLDQLPFEFLNANQETTRISSFYLLKNLYFKYSNNIKNGYLMCSNVDNALVLLNPENNLPGMDMRMKGFYNYWLPKWKIHANVVPSKEQMSEWLTKSNIYVYCGHGAGLQFFGYEDLLKCSINSIVFLFGCGSVGLEKTGFFSELRGSHLHYHMSMCPAVVGMLWTVTDFGTDCCTSKIFSSWTQAPPGIAYHWQNVDKNLWRKSGKISFNKSGDQIFTSASLPEVLLKVRADPDIPLQIRTALVLRGLPVMNSQL